MEDGENLRKHERGLLARHVSDLDAPVFALRNLPEATKGALFARYSRYPGTLRRLMLEEFSEDLGGAPESASQESRRASDLYERVLGEYGDDSVAQLGGAHIACEWVSNVLTKVLQRPRLGAYLEQSTRYIAYDRPMPGGGYRYYREAELGPGYEPAMDSLFETYGSLLPRLGAWLEGRFPPENGESQSVRRRALRAKALDLLRGLLPAATLSHVGIFASGQTLERLILHLRASPLPEARARAELLLAAGQATIPTFLSRVQRPERGGEWVNFLCERRRAEREIAARLGIARAGSGECPQGVRLLEVQGSEDQLLSALLFESAGVGEQEVLERVRDLEPHARAALIAELAGRRANRRHLPGRGFESLRYRFEIVSDYGAFRDLQRHRMLTAQWQTLGPELGAEVPEELVAAGLSGEFESALDRSRQASAALEARMGRDFASYALCLAFRVRYVLDMNAREAIHLIELRSGREGHASYRALAHEMHRLIEGVHPAVAAAMTHLDRTEEPRLERMLAERRAESRRDAAAEMA